MPLSAMNSYPKGEDEDFDAIDPAKQRAALVILLQEDECMNKREYARMPLCACRLVVKPRESVMSGVRACLMSRTWSFDFKSGQNGMGCAMLQRTTMLPFRIRAPKGQDVRRNTGRSLRFYRLWPAMESIAMERKKYPMESTPDSWLSHDDMAGADRQRCCPLGGCSMACFLLTYGLRAREGTGSCELEFLASCSGAGGTAAEPAEPAHSLGSAGECAQAF